MNKAKILPVLPQGENDEVERKTHAKPGNTMKILVVGLMTLAVIQIATVVVLIYLGALIGDLSSDVDNIEANLISEESRSQQDPETPDQEISAGTLILSDEFNDFNLTRWKHEITLGGEGNWQFQYYDNNQSNSYVRMVCFISNHHS